MLGIVMVVIYMITVFIVLNLISAAIRKNVALIGFPIVLIITLAIFLWILL